jgi:signal transduction histidine kinase
VQPGNFFGEMALIDGEPRSAQAPAADAALLGRVDHAAFEKILSIAPRDLHMNFLRSVVERLRGVNSHFISEMMRAERLSVVGTMANSIVHDIKNPITIILSCSELIAMKSKDPSIKEFTTFIAKAVSNMLDMTQELLDFARGESSFQMSREPVASLLAELDAQMNRLIPTNVHVMREIDCTAEVMVDLGRFARMLLNLVKNAIEAMKSGGILRLAVRREYDRVVIRVSDTGCGMSPELQARIFEPFVTFGKSGNPPFPARFVKSDGIRTLVRKFRLCQSALGRRPTLVELELVPAPFSAVCTTLRRLFLEKGIGTLAKLISSRK